MPATKFLVVCGVKNVNDLWMFGNFLGFCRLFKTMGYHEQFWSCYPVRDFFATSKYKNIKFGGTPGDWTPIQVYSKHNFENREEFWTDYDMTHCSLMVGHIFNYIDDMAQRLVAGDKFTIVLIAHGNEQGVKVGGVHLRYDALAQRLDQFRQGVHINIVLQACKSGAFIEKIQARNQPNRFAHTAASNQNSFSERRAPSDRNRNSPFSGAFLSSLDMARDGREWSMQDHTRLVLDEGRSGPTTPQTTPEHYTTTQLHDAFIDVMFNDYVDLSFTQARHSVRRILTPPSPAYTPQQFTVGQISEDDLDYAVKEIEKELDLIDTVQVHQEDQSILQDFFGAQSYRNTPKHQRYTGSSYTYSGAILSHIQEMRWRFRMQENFYLAVNALSHKRLLRLDKLNKPVNWSVMPRERSVLDQILGCFDLGEQCLTREPAGPGKYCPGSFDAPVEWLATLILRCCTNVELTFEMLMTMKLLGEVNMEELQEVDRAEITIQEDRPEIHPIHYTLKPVYCFWLPISFGGQHDLDFAKTWLTRYMRVKDLYEKYFGVGNWGDCSLILECITSLIKRGALAHRQSTLQSSP